jgi:hypothetical protein
LAVLSIVLALSSSAFAVNEYLIKNQGMSRAMSYFGGPLRTNKIDIDGTPLLKQPGVEFQIDIDYKGEPVSLIPGDFEVRNVESASGKGELQASLKMQGKRDGLPILLYVHYHWNPDGTYLQKSIVIPPFKGAPGAVIRRVVIEDLILSPDFEPVSPSPLTTTADASQPDRFTFGGYSGRAVYNQKARKGVFFFTASLFGKESAVGRSLTMWEDVYAPLENGYESGRATIGTGNGSPEVLFKRSREFLWNGFCVAKGRPAAGTETAVTVHPGDTLKDTTGVLSLDLNEWKLANALSPGWSKQADYQAANDFITTCDKLRKSNPGAVIRLIAPKNPELDLTHALGVVDQIEPAASATDDPLASRRISYLNTLVCPPLTLASTKPDVSAKLADYAFVCQQLFVVPDGKSVEGQGHIVDNKGFITLYNPSNVDQKVALPLNEPALELRGAIRLADWTNPDATSDICTVHVGDKVEMDLPAGARRTIAVNLQKSP